MKKNKTTASDEDIRYAKFLLKHYQYRYVPLFSIDECLFKADNLLSYIPSNSIDSEQIYFEISTLLLTNTVTNALDIQSYCRLANMVINYDIKKIEMMEEKNREVVLWDTRINLQEMPYSQSRKILKDLALAYKACNTSTPISLENAKTIWKDLLALLKKLDCNVLPPFFFEYSNANLDNFQHYTVPKPINGLKRLTLDGTDNEHKLYLLRNTNTIPLYLQYTYLIILTHTLMLRNIMRWLSNDWTEINRHKDAVQNCFWGKYLASFPSSTITTKKNYLFFVDDKLYGYKKEIALFLSMLVCESGILFHKNNPQSNPCVKPHKNLFTKIPAKGHFDGTNIATFINPFLLSARLQALNVGKVIMNCPKIMNQARNDWLIGKKSFYIDMKLCENCEYAITYNKYLKQHNITPGIPADCREKTICTKLNTVCEYKSYSLPFPLTDRDIAALLLLKKNDNVSINRLKNGNIAIQKFTLVLEDLYARMPYSIRVLEYRDLLHSNMQSLNLHKSTDILYNAFYPFTNSAFFSGWNGSAFLKDNIKTLLHGFENLVTNDPNYHIKSLAKKILKCFPNMDPNITYPATITNMLATLLRLIDETPQKDIKQTVNKAINAILEYKKNKDIEPKYDLVFNPLKSATLKMMLLHHYGITDYSQLQNFLKYAISIWPTPVNEKVILKVQESYILRRILTLILQEKFNITDKIVCNYVIKNIEPKLDEKCDLTFDGFLNWLSTFIRSLIKNSSGTK